MLIGRISLTGAILKYEGIRYVYCRLSFIFDTRIFNITFIFRFFCLLLSSQFKDGIEVQTKIFPFGTHLRTIKKVLAFVKRSDQSDSNMSSSEENSQKDKESEDESGFKLKEGSASESSSSSRDEEEAEEPVLNKGAPLVAIEKFAARMKIVRNNLINQEGKRN